MAEDEIVNQVFFEKYKTTLRLGRGSFGQVYQGTNLKSNEVMAIKLEVREDNTNLLETEAYRLIYLKGEGVPKVFCYGNNKIFNILVIELLGKSLEDLFNICERKFSLKTVCIIGLEMLKRIQYVHEKNHIHRDIKPDNFMMGINSNENSLYIIDFGLAKKYRPSTKKGHIPFKNHKNITGTARYCSLNTHRGYEQSRRDDLESIGYVLMYFLRGSLPWQGIKCRQDEDHYTKIYEKKKATSLEELCKGFPAQFVQYFDYIRALSFTADPDYELLSTLLMQIIATYCADTTYDFDWNSLLKSPTSIEISSLNVKANTSLALGNNNISHCSPNPKNDSHMNQVNEDINNMSIFQKDCEAHKEFEPSIFENEERKVDNNDNGQEIKNKKNHLDNVKNKTTPNKNNVEIKINDKNEKVETTNKKTEKTTSCRCLIY